VVWANTMQMFDEFGTGLSGFSQGKLSGHQLRGATPDVNGIRCRGYPFGLLSFIQSYHKIKAV
jgi:hypothetical protein